MFFLACWLSTHYHLHSIYFPIFLYWQVLICKLCFSFLFLLNRVQYLFRKMHVGVRQILELLYLRDLMKLLFEFHFKVSQLDHCFLVPLSYLQPTFYLLESSRFCSLVLISFLPLNFFPSLLRQLVSYLSFRHSQLLRYQPLLQQSFLLQHLHPYQLFLYLLQHQLLLHQFLVHLCLQHSQYPDVFFRLFLHLQ